MSGVVTQQSVRPELRLSEFPGKSVCPELVEEQFFAPREQGQGFDKLSPNGWGARA